MVRHTMPLETVAVIVPDAALEVFESALSSVCDTIGFFRDDETGLWRVEGVKPAAKNEAELTALIALAAAVTGVSPELQRTSVAAEGWLARTYVSFPEQLIGRRFAIRGTHLAGPPAAGRITLILDAGLAFGSGEHGSTRGCLLALERVVRRRPRCILDIGTGSGILAMAAARLLKRPVLATDIEPWSIRVTRANTTLNHLSRLVRPRLADGWRDAAVRGGGPYDLVFANILARPLSAMARDLALNLAPGGSAILSGILTSQVRGVLAAHRSRGLRLERLVPQGPWITIVLRK